MILTTSGKYKSVKEYYLHIPLFLFILDLITLFCGSIASSKTSTFSSSAVASNINAATKSSPHRNFNFMTMIENI